MIGQSFFLFFIDPVLRAPMIGSILMCFAAGLMGVIVFLRKESLIGEALSHASYPGIIIGALIAGGLSINENQEILLAFFSLGCAFFTATLGIGVIRQLEKKLKVPNDAALCFVLSTFFGIGLTLASEVQFSFTSLYKQVLTFLYGQAATMTDIHIYIYGLLAIVITLTIFIFYKEIQLISFDQIYAKSLGLNTKFLDVLIISLVTLSIIIGIRSVGVVLMSAMLIAPAVAARQFTNCLPCLFILSGIFGIMSGALGNYLSIIIPELVFSNNISNVMLPTGPMIVLVASLIAGFSLMFAPKRGLFIRLVRVAYFRHICICENVLKTLWKNSSKGTTSLKVIKKYQKISSLYLTLILWRMCYHGWIEKRSNKCFILTNEGKHRASKIVRFHRLWEVYLANYLGFGVEKVHRNAEEIEHIMTPELELELTVLLKNPIRDPHEQLIPPRELSL